ncbi:interleukin-15 [Stigmatopora argus]
MLLHIQLLKCKAIGTWLRLRSRRRGDGRATHVWTSVFMLSLLNSASCTLSLHQSKDAQLCLRMLTPAIKASGAMLYAPTMDDIQTKCHLLSLKCFILELVMVIEEEEVDDEVSDCVRNFAESLRDHQSHAPSCPPCEAHSLGNITTFLDRLNKLLQAMPQLKQMS